MMALGVRSALADVFDDLRAIPDILAVAVARRDGLAVEHDLPAGVDPKKVAAMTAAIVGTGEMSCGELGQGAFRQLIVDGVLGKMIATGAGEEALLVTLVREDANMGLVLLGIDRAVRRIEAALREA